MGHSHTVGAGPAVPEQKPSRWVAVLFGVFIPGAGQLWLGQRWRALFWAVLPLLLMVPFCWVVVHAGWRTGAKWFVPGMVAFFCIGYGGSSRAWDHGRGGGVPLASLVGMPRFVWLAFTPDGQVDWSRYGLSLDTPQLPASMAALEPALRACLAQRPPREQTEPPAAR